MLTIIAQVLMILGFAWLIDTHLGFQLEVTPFLYPFDTATRQILGVPLLALGTFLEWFIASQDRKEMLESM
jgi:hypothetical protein